MNGNTPEIKLCRMGQYAALFVTGAMLAVKDFRVVQSMNGANEVTVTFDVPGNMTELNLTGIEEKKERKPEAWELLAQAFQAVE